MLPDTVGDLLRLYAYQGIKEWSVASGVQKSTASRILGQQRIADNDQEANVTISTVFAGENADRLRFIPMPKHPKNSGIERSFFIPVVKTDAQGGVLLNLQLFLIVSGGNCLAYRFERGRGHHDYAHVQMCRELPGRTVTSTGIPNWFPDKYPAFGMPSAEPLKMFLWMATAVHGNTGGFMKIVQDLFVTAGRPKAAAPYLHELTSMFRS